jgi:hypothetical protein
VIKKSKQSSAKVASLYRFFAIFYEKKYRAEMYRKNISKTLCHPHICQMFATHLKKGLVEQIF